MYIRCFRCKNFENPASDPICQACDPSGHHFNFKPKPKESEKKMKRCKNCKYLEVKETDNPCLSCINGFNQFRPKEWRRPEKPEQKTKTKTKINEQVTRIVDYKYVVNGANEFDNIHEALERGHYIELTDKMISERFSCCREILEFIKSNRKLFKMWFKQLDKVEK